MDPVQHNPKPHLLQRGDWLAGLLTLVVALTVYTLTLQPTVGLEDSGELVVAADYLGVPHPPGYPIWTVLAWLFQLLFHPVSFHGHPNPAWGVNFFSAVSGAAACGVIAMLTSLSGRRLVQVLNKQASGKAHTEEPLFSAAAGITAGLMLAFSQGMWSQSVIAEVYALNVFFQSIMLLLLYLWWLRPDDFRPFYLMAFLYGLGMTNHQTLVFMGLALAAAVWLKEVRPGKELLFSLLATVCAAACIIAPRLATWPELLPATLLMTVIGMIGALCFAWLLHAMPLFRDFFVTALFFVLVKSVNVLATHAGLHHLTWIQGPSSSAFWVWSAAVLLIPLAARFLLPQGRRVGTVYGLVLLGLAFYLYLPIASHQNPPMNWGYARTWEGFLHVLTRGQYERVVLADVFSHKFLLQILLYLRDIRAQFLLPFAVLGLLPFLTVMRTGARNAKWLLISLTAFLGVGLVFIILQNPNTDLQTLFIARVQYIQSHAIYAIWIGYGLLLGMTLLQRLARGNPLTRYGGTLLVLAIPLLLIHKNYTSKEQLKVVGGCEQNGRHYGWYFGHWQLRGAEGIREDLQHELGPEEFEEAWAAYPDPNYPPPMETNALFFGGTDPGRFVPTYMIYSAKVRPDIYLITQNALADHTYMNTMRDLYGDQLWIPGAADSNTAFEQYLADIRSGKQAGADVEFKDGRLSIQGVGGVMQINAYLTKMLFEKNQRITEARTNERTRPAGSAVVPHDPDPEHPRQRAFYVEESYPMPWMYPYLTPHGLIMKLNNEPTELTDEVVEKDRAFWNWLTARFLADPGFKRDITAMKSFSKLRSSLAGLYAARGRPAEAITAFEQSLALYPLSPEAHYRLAELHREAGNYREAVAVMERLITEDPLNDRAADFTQRLRRVVEMDEQCRTLENQALQNIPVNPVELVRLYLSLERYEPAHRLVNRISRRPDPEPLLLLEFAGLFEQIKDFTTVRRLLIRYTELQPDDAVVWIDLAALQLYDRQLAECFTALHHAVEKGGIAAKARIAKDPRLASLRNHPEFKRLTDGLPSATAKPGGPLLPLQP